MTDGSRKQTGFTIVELLIVIVVIGILAAITIVAYNGIQTKAKNAAITSSISSTIKSLEIAKTSTGAYPLEAYVATASGLTGYGSYKGMTTYITNINSLRQTIAARGLEEKDIGFLSFPATRMEPGGQTIVSQDTSAGGYFALDTYNRTNSDNRLTNVFAGKVGLDQKLAAYDEYQRSTLGLDTVPDNYGSSNIFSTFAGNAAPGVRRLYPFTQITSFCHTVNKQCFSYLGYYLYGKTTACPTLGVNTVRITDEVLYGTAGGGARSHNMTFCVTFIGSDLPATYPI